MEIIIFLGCVFAIWSLPGIVMAYTALAMQNQYLYPLYRPRIIPSDHVVCIFWGGLAGWLVVFALIMVIFSQMK